MSAIVVFKKRSQIEDTYTFGWHPPKLKVKTEQLKQMDSQAAEIGKREFDRFPTDLKDKKEWRVTDRYANVVILQLSEARTNTIPSISEMYNDLKNIPEIRKVIMISKDYDQQKLLDKLQILIQLPTYLSG